MSAVFLLLIFNLFLVLFFFVLFSFVEEMINLRSRNSFKVLDALSRVRIVFLLDLLGQILPPLLIDP